MKKIVTVLLLLMFSISFVEVGISWASKFTPIRPISDRIVVQPTKATKIEYTDDYGNNYSFSNPNKKRCVIMYQAKTNSYGLYEINEHSAK
jgi:hypothetical protein